MTQTQLAEIEARLRAATPGPWTYKPATGTIFTQAGYQDPVATVHHQCITIDGKIVSSADVNGPLIAHAPADIAALIAALNLRDLVHVNEVIELQRAVDGRGETIDALEAELTALREATTESHLSKACRDLVESRAQLENAEHRVRVQTSALQHHIKKWTETRDKNFALEAQLEAVTRERDRYKAALSELADIVQGHLDDGDKLDTFTIQPVREALKTTEES